LNQRFSCSLPTDEKSVGRGLIPKVKPKFSRKINA